MHELQIHGLSFTLTFASVSTRWQMRHSRLFLVFAFTSQPPFLFKGIPAFQHAGGFNLSGLMAVAYFMAHAPGGFWPVLNKGELAVLYCFVFLYLSAAGGGPWSLDHLWRRNSHNHDARY